MMTPAILQGFHYIDLPNIVLALWGGLWGTAIAALWIFRK